MMPYVKTFVVVFVALIALAAIWPQKNNPYKTVIELLADKQRIQVDNIQLQSGHYQNVMMVKTVHLELIDIKQAQSIKATAQKWPLFDWQLISYHVDATNK